jgi:glucose-6-phosphate isomerase
MAKVERRSLVSLGVEGLEPFLSADIEGALEASAVEALARVDSNRRGKAWRALLPQLREQDVQTIDTLAAELRANSDVLICLAGGLWHQALRMLLEGLRPQLEEYGPRFLALGNRTSPAQISELMAWLGSRRVSLVTVAGAELPVETGILFRVLRHHVETRHGRAEAARRVVLVTDPEQGPLRRAAELFGYRILPLPRDLAAGFCFFSAGSLLPAALGGINITRLVEGARSSARGLEARTLAANPSLRYAALRHLFRSQGRDLELLAATEPVLGHLAGWFKHVIVQGEGVLVPGLFPVPLELTGDLHHLGPWLQTHRGRVLMSWLSVEQPPEGPEVPELAGDPDGLGGVVGRTLAQVQAAALARVRQAQAQIQVPCLELRIPRLDAFHLGALVYFLQCSAAVSAALAGLDAFVDPGQSPALAAAGLAPPAPGP